MLVYDMLVGGGEVRSPMKGGFKSGSDMYTPIVVVDGSGSVDDKFNANGLVVDDRYRGRDFGLVDLSILDVGDVFTNHHRGFVHWKPGSTERIHSQQTNVPKNELTGGDTDEWVHSIMV